MWQELAKHGTQNFRSLPAVLKRISQLDRALAELCAAIATTASRSEKPGIERARSLRAKPIDGGKSLYECLNQLIHYWYCCAAAKHLFSLGYLNVRVRPTAEESTSTENDAYDVVAQHPTGVAVVGEVFCVSASLWPAKIAKTVIKLLGAPPNSRRLVYYNRDAKPSYCPKRSGLFVFGVDSPSGAVELISSTDGRDLPGITVQIPVAKPA